MPTSGPPARAEAPSQTAEARRHSIKVREPESRRTPIGVSVRESTDFTSLLFARCAARSGRRTAKLDKLLDYQSAYPNPRAFAQPATRTATQRCWRQRTVLRHLCFRIPSSDGPVQKPSTNRFLPQRPSPADCRPDSGENVVTARHSPKGGSLRRPRKGMSFSEWAFAEAHSRVHTDVDVRGAQMSTRIFPFAIGEHEVDFGGDDSLSQCVRAAVDAVAFDLLKG